MFDRHGNLLCEYCEGVMKLTAVHHSLAHFICRDPSCSAEQIVALRPVPLCSQTFPKSAKLKLVVTREAVSETD
jgi:hypothetical protein